MPDQKKDPSYVPPRLNTMIRFAEMTKKADAAQKPAPPKADAEDAARTARIKANAKSMDNLSVDALIKRAQTAAGN